MRTDKSQIAMPPAPKRPSTTPPTPLERLFEVQSMLMTVKMGFLNQMDETGSADLYDLAVTTNVAALMIGSIAEELEKNGVV